MEKARKTEVDLLGELKAFSRYGVKSKLNWVWASAGLFEPIFFSLKWTLDANYPF